MENYYQITESQVITELQTDSTNGLTEEEVAKRREQYGPNELIERGVKSPWLILWQQLSGIMTVILIIAAIISFLLLHEATDAIVILVIVVLNTLLGFTQEYRAERAMAALKKLAVPLVRVRRNGHLREVTASELVPGDIIQVEAGSAIPADSRLLESANLRVQEAVLTGESEPVEKHPEVITADNLTIGDRRNMLYMGTVVTYGRGSAVVTDTGMRTELGKIADMIQGLTQEQTPLQKRLDQLGKGLAVAALVIVGVVFGLGVLRGEEFRIMILTAISMAVAAVPEGLPAVVTIALALGAQRMLKRNALIRKLPAVETLGSVTVICSDKTGTLTENRMTVTMLDVAGNQVDLKETLRFFSPTFTEVEPNADQILSEPSIALMLTGGSLCNDALIEKSDNPDIGYVTVGDPTEGALVIAAARVGLWKAELEKAMPRVAELPFDSDRKRMTTVHRFPKNVPPPLTPILEHHPEFGQNEFVSITKGAVDGLLTISSHVWHENRAIPLTDEWCERIQNANNEMAMNGMRVLGVAFRVRGNANTDDPSDMLEDRLIFIGMFGMIDPARAEVRDAVATAKSAGIRPIMITGDHPLTAMFIARELGIADENSISMIGTELVDIEASELEKQVCRVSVFARVSPEHKLRIVEALQNQGEITAMTGDGVNDAPALKRANIGVAMGITGTDVSKEAADMVLLDDNFATIVAAVEEGRRIYDNIRKFIRYTAASNAGEIIAMLVGPFLGMPMPLTPLQILWINLVTDGVPGLALSVEPAEKDVMQRKPYPPTENIFARGMARDIVWIGILMGMLSLAAGIFAYRNGNPAWQTMVFTTLTFAQMGNALATRSDHFMLFQIGLFSNKAMILAVLSTILLQLAVIYVPFLQNVFGTVPLSIGELSLCIGISTGLFLSVELFKLVRRKLGE